MKMVPLKVSGIDLCRNTVTDYAYYSYCKR
jgi:hypothetical protein